MLTPWHGRGLHFMVERPQVDTDPSRISLGVRRYPFRKNLQSNSLPFGNYGSITLDLSQSPQARVRHDSQPRGYSPQKSPRETATLPPLRQFSTPRNQAASELPAAFKRPLVFTKFRPLIMKTDPISGDSHVKNWVI